MLERVLHWVSCANSLALPWQQTVSVGLHSCRVFQMCLCSTVTAVMAVPCRRCTAVQALMGPSGAGKSTLMVRRLLYCRGSTSIVVQGQDRCCTAGTF